MAEKVAITKTKLDLLADTINTKAGTSGKKTIDQMVEAVKTLSSGSKIKIKSMRRTSGPTKSAYQSGETFSAQGLLVELTYSNNAIKSSVRVTQSLGFSWDEDKVLLSGQTSFTIYYTEDGTTISLDISISVSPTVGLAMYCETPLDASETTAKGLATYDDKFLIAAVDANYNFHKMFYDARTDEHGAYQATTTGGHPASGIVVSNELVAVPMTSSYGGSLNESNYLMFWNPREDFREDGSQFDSAALPSAVLEDMTLARPVSDGATIYGVGGCDGAALIVALSSSGAVTNRSFSGISKLISCAIQINQMAAITGDGKLLIFQGISDLQTCTYSVYEFSSIYTPVKCTYSDDGKVAVVVENSGHYSLYVFDANKITSGLGETSVIGKITNFTSGQSVVGVEFVQISSYLSVCVLLDNGDLWVTEDYRTIGKSSASFGGQAASALALSWETDPTTPFVLVAYNNKYAIGMIQ